jgi:hypothetical protein
MFCPAPVAAPGPGDIPASAGRWGSHVFSAMENGRILLLFSMCDAHLKEHGSSYAPALAETEKDNGIHFRRHNLLTLKWFERPTPTTEWPLRFFSYDKRRQIFLAKSSGEDWVKLYDMPQDAFVTLTKQSSIGMYFEKHISGTATACGSFSVGPDWKPVIHNTINLDYGIEGPTSEGILAHQE